MTIQLAYGGVTTLSDQDSLLSTLSWKEAGYVSYDPVTIDTDTGKTCYILLRQRDGAGGYATIATTDFNVEAIDATTGTALTTTLTKLVAGNHFYNASFDTIQIAITIQGDTQVVNEMMLSVEDASTNEIAQARLRNIDNAEPFGYLWVYRGQGQSRKKTSSYGYSMVLEPSANGAYILLSPGSAFKEVDPLVYTSHFTYPPDQLSYFLEQEENLEDFVYAIDEVSDFVIRENVKVRSVGSNNRVGVVEVDGYLPRAIENLDEISYVDITATGRSSGSEHSFRVYFTKGFRKNQILQP